MLKEERVVREWVRGACKAENITYKWISRDILAFRRAVIESMWKDLEDFIGLDPRHDGDQQDCAACESVRKIRAKYAAIRKGGKR